MPGDQSPSWPHSARLAEVLISGGGAWKSSSKVQVTRQRAIKASLSVMAFPLADHVAEDNDLRSQQYSGRGHGGATGQEGTKRVTSISRSDRGHQPCQF